MSGGSDTEFPSVRRLDHPQTSVSVAGSTSSIGPIAQWHHRLVVSASVRTHASTVLRVPARLKSMLVDPSRSIRCLSRGAAASTCMGP